MNKKIFLLIFSVVLLVGLGSSLFDIDYLNEGLVSHFSFETSLDDTMGLYDLTQVNTNSSTAYNYFSYSGNQGKSLFFSGESYNKEYLTLPDMDGKMGTNVFSISVWVRANGTSTPFDSGDWASILNTNDGGAGIRLRKYSSTSTITSSVDTSVHTLDSSWSVFGTNDWKYLTFVYNGTHQILYINSTLRGIDAESDVPTWTTIKIGRDGTDPNDVFGGLMDEYTIYNRSLNQTEITQLYNSGSGLLFEEDTSSYLNVTINYPTNETITNSTVQFNYTPVSGVGINYSEIYINYSGGGFVLNQTNSSTVENNSVNSFSISGLLDGFYTWMIKVFDVLGNVISVISGVFEIDNCTENLVNTSYGSWNNITSCYVNLTLVQQRNRTQYDNNYCGDIVNVTFYETQEVNCDYDFSPEVLLNYPTNNNISSSTIYFKYTPIDDIGFSYAELWFNSSSKELERNITKIGEFSDSNTTESVSIKSFKRDGSYYAIVSSNAIDTMTIVNITDATTPTFISSLQSNTCYQQGLAVSEDGKTYYSNTYLTGHDSFCTTNITDLYHPTILDTITNNTNLYKGETVEIYERWDQTWAVTGGEYYTNLINVTDPTDINIINFYKGNSGFSDNRVYGNYLYVTKDDYGLEVINFTEYTNMNLIAQYPLSGWHTEGLGQDPKNESIIYLTSAVPGSPNNIIRTYDISDVENQLILLDSYQNASYLYSFDDFVILDDYTMLGAGANGNTFMYINITDPYDLKPMAKTQTYSGGSQFIPVGMALDDRDYLAVASAGTQARLQIFDLNGIGSSGLTLNQTNQSTLINNSINNIVVSGMAEGIYSWMIKLFDNGGNNVNNLSQDTFTINYSTSSTPSTLLNNLLIAYKFDDLNSIVLDSSKNNNGSRSGVSNNEDGRIGKSYLFSGNGYVKSDSIVGISGTDNRTGCAWIKPTSLNPNDLIFELGNNGLGHRWSLTYNNGLRIEIDGTGSTSTLTPALNEWSLVCVTFNGTQLQDNYIYLLNGTINMEKLSGTTTINTDNTIFRIGNGTNINYNFNGRIDDVNLWNRSLSFEEIYSIYAGNLTYSFGGGSGGSDIVVLDYPTNNSEISDLGVRFNATVSSEYNIANITYYVWAKSGSSWNEFNVTALSYMGQNNITESLFIDSFNLGNYKWNIEACFENTTSYCSFSENNYTFYVGSGVTGESYNNITFETSYETFIANISTLNDSILYQVKLYYNGSEHIGVVTDLGGTNYTLTSSFNVPTVSSDTNFSWYWVIEYDENSSIITQNLSSHTQLVKDITDIIVTSSSCGAGYFKAINYTFQNANTKAGLTIDTIHYNFKYGVGNTSAKEIYGTFTNTATFNVCVNSSFNEYKFGYGEVEYEEATYVQRKHYLYENQEISNGTTRSYILYSLPTADSTSFIFEVKDSGNTPYTNKLLALLRWYPETNGYLVVEMAKTDETGQTVMKVKTEDIDYRVGIYELDGSLIKLADPVRMACLIDPCTYTLSVRGEDTNYFSYEDVEGSLTFDEVNNRFLLVFNDVTQVTDSMRMEVYKVSGSQDILICEDEVTGYTGVLSCSIGTYTGTFYAKVYRTASPERVFQKIFYTNRESVESSFGLVLSIVLALAGGLMGIFSPVIAVIMVLVGLLLSLFLGSISIGIFMGIASMGGIVIHYILKLK